MPIDSPMLIDSHCHLDTFGDELDAVLEDDRLDVVFECPVHASLVVSGHFACSLMKR